MNNRNNKNEYIGSFGLGFFSGIYFANNLIGERDINLSALLPFVTLTLIMAGRDMQVRNEFHPRFLLSIIGTLTGMLTAVGHKYSSGEWPVDRTLQP